MRARIRVSATVASILVLACGGRASDGAVSPDPAATPQPAGTSEPTAPAAPVPEPSATPVPAAGTQPSPSAPPGAAGTIGVSFKLDPRLHGGTYGGEVWVSPATYTGVAGQYAVEARAHGFDANGDPTAISPDWVPSDPGLVTVSPARGDRVTITATRAGESRLALTSPGLVAKELVVRATSQDGRIVQVEISQ